MTNNFEGFDNFDEMMESFMAEEEKKAAAPKTPNPSVKAKEQKASADKEKKPKKVMLRVSGAKEFVFGNKTTPIANGTFAKANVSEEDVCSAFAKATESWCSGKAFSAKLVSATIRIGYTKSLIGDGDTILAPIFGFPVITPEGDSFDLHGTITVATIRDRLTELGGVYAKYADAAYGFVQDVDQIYIVPIASEFEVPYAETVMVAWDDKGVAVRMTTKSTSKPASDAAEDEDDSSDDVTSEEGEGVKAAPLTSAAIRDAFEKKVKGVGNFELALKADGTIIAVPVTDHFNKYAKSSVVSESEIQRPITPTLKIYWGRDCELPLYNLQPQGDLPGTVGMTTISEKEALKILQAWYPEYSKIKGMTWFEELNYWFPNYPSSTKGGGAGTPLFSVSEDKKVLWHAPKIGADLLAQVWKASLEEEAGSGNEKAAAMLLDERTNSWRVSFPTQSATPTSVTCNYGEECEIPYETVGVQMHSHPNMSISFSSIDDRDELSESTLFCVLRRGNSGKGHELDCRIRHKGKFYLVPMELAFDL